MPNPYNNIPNMNLGYTSDANAQLRKFDPQAYIRSANVPGTTSVAQYAELIDHIKTNPYQRSKLLQSYTAARGLFAANPEYAQMLAPGAPKILAVRDLQLSESIIQTPTRNPSLRFGTNKLTRSGHQVTSTRFNIGGQYPHIEAMAIRAALNSSGMPDPRNVILEHMATTLAAESSRMAYAQLMAMLYDNWHNTTDHDLIVDISASSDDPKYVVLLYGGPVIWYDYTPSLPVDNEGQPSISIISEGASGYGAGSTMMIERYKNYCVPHGYTWLGQRQEDMFVTRPELLDFTNNWKRIPEIDRRDLMFGAIICNASPGTTRNASTVTRDNCISAPLILDIAQQFWGDAKSQITNIIMPSAVENYLTIMNAMVEYPVIDGGVTIPTTVPRFANRTVTVTDMLPLWRPDVAIEDQFNYLFPTNKADLRLAIKDGFMTVPGINIAP